ncbi:hypothetical protein FWH58_00895 [Candidatus Saccharibacteria bacterium]|nr:hypothetical protein [Candidatus Saccharibacteria bacterium]
MKADIPQMSIGDLIRNGLNVVYFVVGIIAVIMIIIAGYTYLTADGDPEKSKKGMRTIIYSFVGLVVVICAFAITNFMMGGMAKT